MKKFFIFFALLLVFTSCTKIETTAQTNANIIKDYMREWKTDELNAHYKDNNVEKSLYGVKMVSDKYIVYKYPGAISNEIIFNLSEVKRIQIGMGSPVQINLIFY